MAKSIQRVYFTDSAQKPLDVSLEASYDKLELISTQGILVWQKDKTTIPHANVLAIVEMELTEPETKQE